MVSTLFRDPQALSSDLAALGTLQPQAFGSLNRVETLDSASKYYLEDTRVPVYYGMYQLEENMKRCCVIFYHTLCEAKVICRLKIRLGSVHNNTWMVAMLKGG